MKIAIAGGHSKKAPGAIGLLNEYECDRAYVAKLIPALEAAGHTVVNCSNEAATMDAELAEEVRIANNSNADLFIAIHFNAGGGSGTECYEYINNTSQLAKTVSAKLSENVSTALGIANRGAKKADFYVLRATYMPAVLLEVCFVDNAADKAAWDRTSWQSLADAVVSAVGTTGSSEGWVKDSKGWWYREADGSYPKSAWREINGRWYYFDATGYAVTGWQYVKGEWYYLLPKKEGNRPECSMLTGWLKDEGVWYYLTDSGAMARSCTKEINGKHYAFDSHGAMIEGSVPIDKNGALILG